MNFHQFEVRIFDRQTRRTLTGKEAQAYLVWKQEQTPLIYDPAAEAFVGDKLIPGLYSLRVARTLAEITEHLVQVDPAPSKITLWTGSPALPDGTGGYALLGVLPHPTIVDKPEALDRFVQSAASLGLEPVRGWSARTGKEPWRKLAVFSFRPPSESQNQAPLSVLAGGLVEQLLAHEAVAAAGPFVGEPAAAGFIWTQQIYLRLAPGTSLREATEIAARHRLSGVTRLPVGEDLFITMLEPKYAFELKEVLSGLEGEALVRHAEPVPVAEIEADCCSDHGEPLWDRSLVGAQDAAALLDESAPPPLLALVDNHWQSPEDVRTHPELCEPDGSPGARLVASLHFDSGPWPTSSSNAPPNGGSDASPPRSHALMCAGIAAGRVSGVAPRSRVLLFKDPDDLWSHICAWLWAGGSISGFPVTGLPVLPGGGADVFCAPIGRYQEITDDGVGALRRLVVAGRHGRGCPLFFSAGNLQADITKVRPYAALPFTFAITASTYNAAGEERFALDSGWGDVDLCAPTGTEKVAGNAGGRFDGVMAAEIPHRGTYPYRVLVDTWTTADVASEGSTEAEPVPVSSALRFVCGSHAMLVSDDGQWASREIFDVQNGQILLRPGALDPFPASSCVVSASRRLGSLVAAVAPAAVCLKLDSVPLDPLEPGQKIRVGTPGVTAVGEYTVLSVSGHTITVCEKLSAHCVGDPVFVDQSHWNLSAGTSTATPLCAGTAALMLAANPRLSWVEVRHLLRTTAVKIDTECTDPLAAWLGQDGQPNKEQPFFSRRYGFGRLDARQAVRLAIDYDFPRDLMIRQYESDDGTSRVRPLGDSPDIWVRAQDPRCLSEKEREDPRLHEAVLRSRDCWIFARVRNRGHVNSLEAWVRFYVAAGQEELYRFPEDFELRRAEILDQGIWRRGTQFLGEVKIVDVPPGDARVFAVWWNPARIPPAFDSEGQPWDPHILVAISPLDGPGDGVTMLDCNNLAQRAIEIRDCD